MARATMKRLRSRSKWKRAARARSSSLSTSLRRSFSSALARSEQLRSVTSAAFEDTDDHLEVTYCVDISGFSVGAKRQSAKTEKKPIVM